MKPLHIETPLFESRPLSLHAGRSVWLKLDALQPPGSFKIRGIGFACQKYVRRGAKRLISSSGGNAGIAVAYAGRHLSVPVLIVVPETTSELAKALIRREGAEVIVHGDSWQEANELAESTVGESDVLVHPFDDPLVWQGHSTLIDEVAGTGVKPGALVVCVGGGGLLCGLVEGMSRNGWNDVPVIAVETEGADSLAQSVRAGHRVELAAITSLAITLGAKKICARAFDCTRDHPLRSIVVSDRGAVSACQRFLDDHRLVVEPACGASLAAVYEGAPELEDFESVLVIVCGGATTTLEQLREWARASA
ncbi:MAG: pyridoxal-phosphate dependent enzyme [Holophagales bacterium]|nr:pyridoxal-phosphate dependent enzyme [Holophagales bacterium]MYD22861.1 pyridoxal-phosphate dependent enzyme [Holophagales bacterium]MYI32165.1 pyridoxal-phosphate dependent enzyme [Holophagales bacterium]